MSPVRRNPIPTVLIALALAALACAGGRATATPTPQITETAVSTVAPTNTQAPAAAATPTTAPTESGSIVAGAIQVINSSSYVDEYSYYHVVGEVFNGTERPVTNIEISIEVRDAAGASVLDDGSGSPPEYTTFSPLLYTLAPGESSPFDYYLSAFDLNPAGWEYTLEITGQRTGQVNRGELVVENDLVTYGEFGTIYVTGELVNLTGQPVLVNGLAGALLDTSGAVVAADASYVLARYLAEAGDSTGNDRTPFMITLDGPVSDPSETAFYWDVDITDPLASGADVGVEVVNGYVDAFDRLHLVTTVTNNGTEQVIVTLVAGLYAADGAVLDAASLATSTFVGPGDTIPVTLEYFGSVDSNRALLDRLDYYTVQVDPYWTYPTAQEIVALETVNEVNEPGGSGLITYSGEIVNTSDRQVSYATVILAVYDETFNLVTSSWANASPEAEFAAPQDTLTFEVAVYLPPETDASLYSFVTYVQGYVR